MTRWLVLVGVMALLSCQNSGGCGNDYPYPRTDSEAAVSPKAMRGRLSEAGLATAARAMPDLLAAACAANPADGSAGCATDPVDGNKVRFYIGSEAEPFDFTLPYSSGEVRPNSYVAVDMNSLHNNLQVQLVDVVGGQDGVRVSVGCAAADFANCTDTAAFVDSSLDLSVYVAGLEVPLVGSFGESVCFAQDGMPPAPGMRIQSLIFTFYPRIETHADGRPYLQIEENDVVVERMEVALEVQTGKACWEDACGACGAGDCSLCTTASVLTDYVLEPLLESGTLARTLSTLIAKQALASLIKGALDVAGALDATSVLSFVNPRAKATSYLVAANPDSPTASGSSSALGLNVDFDVGFIAPHGSCVPVVEPPSWVMPATPDPGAYVIAPDPVTGEPAAEAYDAAVILGDSVPGRALFELFDSGSFCLNLDADLMSSLSNGLFVPTVSSLSAIAPGLVGMAPSDAPVAIVTSPSLPAQLRFGTGNGEGETRDSHLQLTWPSFGVELWPLIDDSYQRAVAISCDLTVAMSFEPTPTGNLLITVDRIALDNLLPTYNEVPVQFDAQGLSDVVAAFVPSLVTGEPFDVQLTAAVLGFPFVPKARAVTALGADKRFLGMFLRFCAPRDLSDPGNPLCYEPSGDGRQRALAIPTWSLETEVSPTPESRGRWQVRAQLATPHTQSVELALRVDGGATMAFVPATNEGRALLQHPALALPGEHEVTVTARIGHSLQWMEPVTMVLQVPARQGVAASQEPRQAQPERIAQPERSLSAGCRAVPATGVCLWGATALLARLFTRSRRYLSR